MIALKIFLLIINIVSLGVVVILLPLGIYEFFNGRPSAQKLVEKLKIPFSYEKLECIFLICLFVALISFIIRDQL